MHNFGATNKEHYGMVFFWNGQLECVKPQRLMESRFEKVPHREEWDRLPFHSFMGEGGVIGQELAEFENIFCTRVLQSSASGCLAKYQTTINSYYN